MGKWIGNLIFKRHEIEKTNNAKDQITDFHVPTLCIFESRRALKYFDTVVTYYSNWNLYKSHNNMQRYTGLDCNNLKVTYQNTKRRDMFSSVKIGNEN